MTCKKEKGQQILLVAKTFDDTGQPRAYGQDEQVEEKNLYGPQAHTAENNTEGLGPMPETPTSPG